MKRTGQLSILAATTVLAVSLVAVPVGADSWFSVTVAGDNFAVGFGAGEWAPYGASWSDPGWSVDYRSSLGGYGEWVWVDGLGSVWRPWVAADWRPYTHGRWVWTSFGWTWVAYEPWGWLPHHYGSWALASAGWVWVPGYEYRSANVVWVTSGHYVGWYPCAPSGWSHHHRGFRQGYRHGYDDGHHDGYRRGRHDGYHNGYDDGWNDAMEATWVDRRHVGADDLSRHAVDHGRLSRSGVIAKPAVLTTAPSRVELDRHAERRIPEARVSTRTVELSGRQVVAVRAEGVAKDVASHSLATTRTALSPAVAERVERQVATAEVARPRSDAADRKPVAQGRTPTTQDRKPFVQERVPVAQERSPRATAPGTSSRGATVPSRPSSAASTRTSSGHSLPIAARSDAAEASATRRGGDTPVRRPPAVATTTRVEAEQRSRTVSAPAVRTAPRVDRRPVPAGAVKDSNRATTKPAAAAPVASKASAVRSEDRKAETKVRPKPATTNAPQTRTKSATSKGRR